MKPREKTTQPPWQSYPAYKESGVPWLGKTPEHWGTDKIKFYSDVQFSSVDKHTLDDELPVRLCNYVDVYKNEHITDEIDFMKASASPNEIQNFKLRRGDVIITKDSESWNDIGVPAYVSQDFSEPVICGYHLALIRPEAIDGAYLFRVLQSREVNYQFQIAANGITRYGIGKYSIDNGIIPIPPLPEQRAIADFLDRETARIDALVKKYERLMELLEEKRTSLISRAVTRGLDDSVEMKDSGVEWLGQIPKHWVVRKVKHVVTKIGSGKTPRGGNEIYENKGVIFIRSQNVHFDGLRLDDVAYIDYEIDEEMQSTRLQAQDVLLNITGASLGRTAVVPEELPNANVNQHVSIIRANQQKILPYFLHAVISSDAVQAQIFSGESGAAREGLSSTKIANLVFAMPKEIYLQSEVVSQLGHQLEELSSVKKKIELILQNLREYRTAIISAAVTGKIRVTD